MKLRRCAVYSTYKKEPGDYMYNGTLHGFSTEYEELQNGVGQYPVAIIENNEGELNTEPVRCVKLFKEERE